jgi:hypothetical protein
VRGVEVECVESLVVGGEDLDDEDSCVVPDPERPVQQTAVRDPEVLGPAEVEDGRLAQSEALGGALQDDAELGLHVAVVAVRVSSGIYVPADATVTFREPLRPCRVT